jgi:hypothetical protein
MQKLAERFKGGETSHLYGPVDKDFGFLFRLKNHTKQDQNRVSLFFRNTMMLALCRLLKIYSENKKFEHN